MLTFRPKKERNLVQHALLVSLVGGALAYTGFQESKKELPLPVPSPISTPIVINHVTEIQQLHKEIERLKVSRGSNRQDTIIKAMNNHLRGRLTGKGEVIYKASRKQEPAINPVLVTAIILHELGVDCDSPLFARTDNVAGINWTSNSPYDKDGRYNNYRKKGGIDASIGHLCELLSKYYIGQGLTNIDAIGKKYAPLSDKDNGRFGMSNEAWIPHITELYQIIAQEAGL